MASVLPKVKTYFFISIICLLINVAVLMTAVITTDATSSEYLEYDQANVGNKEAPDFENVTALSIGASTAGSFVPFFSLVTYPDFLDKGLPVEFTVISALVIAIIGAFQLFLLAIIIINMFPKILGSGFDV